ncbi:MAG: metallophosphoesterase [Thermoleophilia bacterium]|nr:metallophosphoesterase [Thermoleophilia bacterium]
MAETTGIIGDIHLDLAGLEAAIAGPLAECGRFVVTGDFLDRGPGDPHDVLERVLALPDVVVLAGNHELAYLGGPSYRGMAEPRCAPLAPLLRDLVIDGRLRAAASVHGVLCVHGGVSRAFWQRHLEADCGGDPVAAVAKMNRLLVRAVGTRDFTHPLFGALEARIRGPFWAGIGDDLLATGTPPFDQVVGHVPMSAGWHSPANDAGGGRVLSVCREHRLEGSGAAVGCVSLGPDGAGQ